MADNVGWSEGSGKTLAADDVAGVMYPRTKIALGADGVSDGDVSASNPMPVQDVTLADVMNSINTLNDTMVFLLSAMLEKMPRVTANDQAAVALESGTLTTITTVTTVGTTTNQAQIGGQEALTVARAQMMQGTSHIYNNILVS